MTERPAQRTPNRQLAALIAEAGFSNAGLARRVDQLGLEHGLDLRYDKTSVTRWLRGQQPRGTTPADNRKATSLLAALGETIWVTKEDLIDSVTAVSGSGPAYLFLMAEAMTEAGIAEGLAPEQAEKLARATVAGSGALLAADKSPASALREAVTSPGGTTQAALNVLMADDGLVALVKRAIHAARKRAEELR